MEKAKKNTVIHAAADRMAANYKSSQIPMYGDALRMPNRNAVIEIIRDCQKLIFPVYYGDRDLLKLPPEQYSALLMEHIHEKLTRQITLTMPECDENCEVAYAISTAFIERIPVIQELLLKDLSANFEGDPAAYSKEEVLLSYPGMFAIFIYRIAHELYENKVAMIPRMMSEYAHSQTGIDINPGAKIGEYFFIDHGTGIVVHQTLVGLKVESRAVHLRTAGIQCAQHGALARVGCGQCFQQKPHVPPQPQRRRAAHPGNIFCKTHCPKGKAPSQRREQPCHQPALAAQQLRLTHAGGKPAHTHRSHRARRRTQPAPQRGAQGCRPGLLRLYRLLLLFAAFQHPPQRHKQAAQSCRKGKAQHHRRCQGETLHRSDTPFRQIVILPLLYALRRRYPALFPVPCRGWP